MFNFVRDVIVVVASGFIFAFLISSTLGDWIVRPAILVGLTVGYGIIAYSMGTQNLPRFVGITFIVCLFIAPISRYFTDLADATFVITCLSIFASALCAGAGWFAARYALVHGR